MSIILKGAYPVTMKFLISIVIKMKKCIHIQTQNINASTISKTRQVGWCAVNIDNIRIIFDAYNGSGPDASPRHDSLIRIVDDRQVRELTPEYLLEAVKFFEQYNEMGTHMVTYKNLFHVVMPDAIKKP